MSDPRYPIGKFVRPTQSDAASRQRLVESIASIPGRVREAVRGWTDAQLDTPYRDGGWTVRQLVHHIADSHMNAFIRLKLALTEANPTVKPYDENAWADLSDMKLPIDLSLGIIDGVHTRWVNVLRSMSAADFARTLMHPQNGPMTVDVLTALYGWHGEHHLAHITTLKGAKGW